MAALIVAGTTVNHSATVIDAGAWICNPDTRAATQIDLREAIYRAVTTVGRTAVTRTVECGPCKLIRLRGVTCAATAGMCRTRVDRGELSILPAACTQVPAGREAGMTGPPVKAFSSALRPSVTSCMRARLRSSTASYPPRTLPSIVPRSIIKFAQALVSCPFTSRTRMSSPSEKAARVSSLPFQSVAAGVTVTDSSLAPRWTRSVDPLLLKSLPSKASMVAPFGIAAPFAGATRARLETAAAPSAARWRRRRRFIRVDSSMLIAL